MKWLTSDLSCARNTPTHLRLFCHHLKTCLYTDYHRVYLFIYLFIMHLVHSTHKKRKHRKNTHKNREKTYKIHTDSNIKSISVALKPGIIISLLLTRNISMITEQYTSDWTATLLCTKFLLIHVSLDRGNSKREQHN